MQGHRRLTAHATGWSLLFVGPNSVLCCLKCRTIFRQGDYMRFPGVKVFHSRFVVPNRWCWVCTDLYLSAEPVLARLWLLLSSDATATLYFSFREWNLSGSSFFSFWLRGETRRADLGTNGLKTIKTKKWSEFHLYSRVLELCKSVHSVLD